MLPVSHYKNVFTAIIGKNYSKLVVFGTNGSITFGLGMSHYGYVLYKVCVSDGPMFNLGKGIMTTVPAWCVSAHASFVFKIDSQKTQCLLIALNKMQLLKR